MQQQSNYRRTKKLGMVSKCLLQSYCNLFLAPPENEQVNGECSNTKGHWVPEDRSFGYKGLNIPRSRHASEVLKTTERRNGKVLVVQTLWVFGGYNSLQ